MTISHLLFDFDGTLADSSLGIFQSFSKACAAVGREPPELGQFKIKIGPPIEQLCLEFFPDLTDEDKFLFRSIFRQEYDGTDYVKLIWYDGVSETLLDLKLQYGLKLSVVSNKPTKTCESLLAIAGFDAYFDSIVGVDYLCIYDDGDVFHCKSEAINYVILVHDLNRDETSYVGDTLSDQYQSKVAGISFIAAKYGFYAWPDESIPILSISDFPSLLPLVGQINSISKEVTTLAEAIENIY